MNRKIRLVILLTALASLFLLTGCTLGNSVESLFTLPQLPEEYQELSETLDQMLDEGYSYITPTQGPNIEPVQMVDLDGDGIKEAVALLQHSGESKPLKVMIFQQDESRFNCICTVESAALGIDNINYHDLTDDGVAELLLGWRGEDEGQILSVYRIDNAASPLLEQEYAEYRIQDLTGQGLPGLVLLRESVYHEPFAEYYTCQTDKMRLESSCAINSDMAAIRRGSVVSGFLEDGIPAVFITGVQSRNLAMTDVLIYGSEGLANTVRGDTPYHYCQLDPQDINGDGITEVPYRVLGPDDDDTLAAKDTLVNWLCYDRLGGGKKVAETYHCQSFGWYVTFPEKVWDSVTASNGDTFNGENCVEFSVQDKPVAAIFSITCENRESRAQMGDRFIVTRLPDTIYAAEVYEQISADSLDPTALRDSFALIVNTWDAGGKE